MRRILSGFGLLILSLGLMVFGISEVKAEEKPRLAIVPFFIEREPVCPVCKTVFQRGEILPSAQNTLTKLLYQRIEGKGIFKSLPLEKVEQALSQQEKRIFEERPKSSSIELGKELGSDFVSIGFIFRFEERIGSSVGVDRPASVGFDIHLIRLKDGAEVWRGRMDETQRPLSENLFKIGSFFRRKAHWLTAEELAGVGLDEVLRRLPGITELEGK
ncbi:MAG: hypothetical protein FJ115_09455 [Deltaproteobacteria bacterium]|nr:hypothetical protein [Deltaproteobacteria bacterium]MBM4323770.1 hypothetical protein [Deltaproteobacteria bacterium]